ncbi:hypothetical protein Cpir12675_003333 [Ceratocystis pirilliformis]|uniref:Band 7 domain-containing protein n=1 Tax=Ceratocystis pirilliformis TaxID=259994 RepID=A0ABR3Z3E9_9PEZI
MTIEETSSRQDLFKNRIQKDIQTELDQFGLRELRDAPGSTYLESLSHKAHGDTINQAQIDVAEAQSRRNVGEADQKGMQDCEITKINAETSVQKTERDIERAQSEARLKTERITLPRDVDISRIEAKRVTESCDEDLKRQVEMKRKDAEMERMRAVDVVKATILREAKHEQLTDTNAYKLRTEAEVEAQAKFQRITKKSDAFGYKTRVDADAESYAEAKKADMLLARQRNEAEGIAALANAYAKMAQAFGGPQGLRQFLMIENSRYVELAKANAAAIKGMEPKISAWTTGGAGSNGGSESSKSANSPGIDTIRNVYQMLPPLMTTINEQTGITLPEWQFGIIAIGADEINKRSLDRPGGNNPALSRFSVLAISGIICVLCALCVLCVL